MKNLYKYTIIIGILVIGAVLLNINPNKESSIVSNQTKLLNENFNNHYMTKLSSPIENYNTTIPDEFIKKLENEYLELYLEESTMAIAIKDKSNNYVWFSYDSDNPDYINYSDQVKKYYKAGVSINTYNQNVPGLRTGLDSEVEIKYQYNPDEVVVSVDYTKIQIKFEVHIKLDQKDLLVEVPHSSIEEYNPKLWQPGNDNISLNSIILFPFLGSTDYEENGYIVIPDGTGAIVTLKEEPKYKINYKSPIYGSDNGYIDTIVSNNLQIRTTKSLSRVTLPIYGVIHDVNNTGLLVISESGANYAKYNYITKGLSTKYYQSYFEYTYRTEYKQYQSRVDQYNLVIDFQEDINKFDIKQRYVLLNGEDADYVGVAKNYRQFLENNGGFSQQDVKSNNMQTKIDIIGNEITRGIFFDKNISTTTYQDAIELITQIRNDGYDNLNVTYKTFNKSDYAYTFDVFRNLGGKNDFNEMIDYLNNNEIDFNYYIDYVKTFNKSKYTASRMNKTALTVLNYSYMYDLAYINKIKYLPEFIDDDLKQFSKYELETVALDGLNNAIYTQNEKNKVIYSTENMDIIMSSLDKLKDNNINVNLYNPDAYLYKYTNNYFETPLSSSELMFMDATIPLLQLIISGQMNMYSPYLNFISNDQNTLLRMVEYGINPSYLVTKSDVYDLKYSNSSEIYVTQYESLSNRMKQYNSYIETALNSSNGNEMINHTFLADDITMTEYENGVKIIVNYSNNDFVYGETIIKAKDYGVI